MADADKKESAQTEGSEHLQLRVKDGVSSQLCSKQTQNFRSCHLLKFLDYDGV